jgi:hypothetical protein
MGIGDCAPVSAGCGPIPALLLLLCAGSVTLLVLRERQLKRALARAERRSAGKLDG